MICHDYSGWQTSELKSLTTESHRPHLGNSVDTVNGAQKGGRTPDMAKTSVWLWIAPGDGRRQSSLTFVSRRVAFAPHSPRGSPSGSHRWRGLPQIPSCMSSLESWTLGPWSSCPRPGRWPSQKQSGSLLRMCFWRSHTRNVSPCTRKKVPESPTTKAFNCHGYRSVLHPHPEDQGRKHSTKVHRTSLRQQSQDVGVLTPSCF